MIMDSGFRRGTDVLKALALGADFCFIGRPFLCAAALPVGTAYPRGEAADGRNRPRHGDAGDRLDR